MTLQIVPFSQAHATEAAILHKDAFFRHWKAEVFEEYAINQKVIGFSVIEENKLLGFILAREVQAEAEILTFVVAPGLRKQGVGKFLLKYILDFLLQIGVQIVYLEVKHDNQGAIELYKQAGFALIGKRNDYYLTAEGPKKAAFTLRKIL